MLVEFLILFEVVEVNASLFEVVLLFLVLFFEVFDLLEDAKEDGVLVVFLLRCCTSSPEVAE